MALKWNKTLKGHSNCFTQYQKILKGDSLWNKCLLNFMYHTIKFHWTVCTIVDILLIDVFILCKLWPGMTFCHVRSKKANRQHFNKFWVKQLQTDLTKTFWQYLKRGKTTNGDVRQCLNMKETYKKFWILSIKTGFNLNSIKKINTNIQK